MQQVKSPSYGCAVYYMHRDGLFFQHFSLEFFVRFKGLSVAASRFRIFSPWIMLKSIQPSAYKCSVAVNCTVVDIRTYVGLVESRSIVADKFCGCYAGHGVRPEDGYFGET